MPARFRLEDTVVFRFNRRGRTRKYLISLLGDFREWNIQFWALDLVVDSDTPAGKMVL
jgi:DNA invertase Pin-like site-specific DNA recombinase